MAGLRCQVQRHPSFAIRRLEVCACCEQGSDGRGGPHKSSLVQRSATIHVPAVGGVGVGQRSDVVDQVACIGRGRQVLAMGWSSRAITSLLDLEVGKQE